MISYNMRGAVIGCCTPGAQCFKRQIEQRRIDIFSMTLSIFKRVKRVLVGMLLPRRHNPFEKRGCQRMSLRGIGQLCSNGMCWRREARRGSLDTRE